MQSEVRKTCLPLVAGILTLASGLLKLISVFVLLIIGLIVAVGPRSSGRVHPAFIFLSLAVIMLITGVLAVIGGIYNIKRNNWGLSLTGAIAAFLPFNLLGLVSIILLAISKNEFEK